MLKETKKRFLKNSIIHLLYTFIVIIDHIVLVKLTISRSLKRDKLVVCDEYVVDTLARDITMEPEYFHKAIFILAWTLYKLIPKPKIAFFIKVDENSAFNRKDDIPSKKHLTNRLKVYHSLVPFYDLKVLDGSQNLNLLLENILQDLSPPIIRTPR